MSQSQENLAKALTKQCAVIDADTQRLIDLKVKELADLVHCQQQTILEKLLVYRGQLAESGRIHVEEFYDLVAFVYEDHKFSRALEADFICEKSVREWFQNQWNAPNMPERRHLMLLFLDIYLKDHILSGLGRLSQSITPLYGGDLFDGEHVLPALPVPTQLSRTADGRWRIADVVLPHGVAWYLCPANCDRLNSVTSFASVMSTIGDLVMCDIIRPKGSAGHQKLHTRLQKIPGVGSKGARAIRTWLEDIGCAIDSQ